MIHHMFMAGDANAPLRPTPPPNTKMAKRKTQISNARIPQLTVQDE